MSAQDLNCIFCDLAMSVFGHGWVRAAAEVRVADLRTLRAYQSTQVMRPLRAECDRLIAQAKSSIAIIEVNIAALEQAIKDGAQ